ncbi:hypothetical protein GY14_16735 [Delftia tsuruhatensis]|nr:hypothetical protein GY14_16735 [Delftia tsuruhatensis]
MHPEGHLLGHLLLALGGVARLCLGIGLGQGCAIVSGGLLSQGLAGVGRAHGGCNPMQSVGGRLCGAGATFAGPLEQAAPFRGPHRRHAVERNARRQGRVLPHAGRQRLGCVLMRGLGCRCRARCGGRQRRIGLHGGQHIGRLCLCLGALARSGIGGRAGCSGIHCARQRRRVGVRGQRRACGIARCRLRSHEGGMRHHALLLAQGQHGGTAPARQPVARHALQHVAVALAIEVGGLPDQAEPSAWPLAASSMASACAEVAISSVSAWGCSGNCVCSSPCARPDRSAGSFRLP